MSTKDALALLESVSDDKKVFLDIAKSYVADKLNVYYSVENCICLKEDDMIPFGELPEFAELRQKVNNIENAKGIIDDFFEIDDDIAKINQYLDDELLIAYMEVDDYDNDSSAEGFSSSVMPSYGADEDEEEEEEGYPLFQDSDSVDEADETEQPEDNDTSSDTEGEPAQTYPDEPQLGNFYGGYDSEEETPKEEEKPAEPEETEERIVGIYKEEYDTSWAPDYEPDEDDYFLKQSESELLGEDEKPKLNSLFTDDVTKTEKKDILDEAAYIIDQGSKFIFTGASPQVYLNKRFEYLRIKYALKNIEDGEDEDPEIEIIKNELIKLRGYAQRGVIMPVEAVRYDMMMVEKVYGLLKEFDESLYPAGAIPNIDDILKLMDVSGEYDEKATKLHQFYMVDTINFLKTIYKNCSGRELDKNKRISVEREKLDDKHFEDMRNLEREFYAARKKIFGGGKSDYENKKKALEDEYNAKVKELEDSIQAVIEQDTKMVGKNMKLYTRIDKILRNNVLCFQAK
ncbi:MAG: hypothetical protein IKS17_11010 [Firmicutes bacterium]|nr:hypothetical protein [Bacillota bacterium]